jgi:sugar-specific transcriptional regulator TrmB
MDLDKTLIEYGLKEKQALVYLACLQVGSGSILKIAERAGLARSTTELELKALQQKGLVSSYKKRTVHHYTADDPHKIIYSLKEKTELIQRTLPKFMAMYASSRNKPSVSFYEGRLGMKLVLDQMLAEARELFCFSSADDLFAILEEWPEFVKERVKLKIPVKVILRDSEKARERKQLGVLELREVRLIGPEYDYHGMIYVWGNKIGMFSFRDDLMAVLVESKELAEVQKSLFLALWNKVG